MMDGEQHTLLKVAKSKLHIGIAGGSMIVGYVGTPRKYNCSVFGTPVVLAASCVEVKSNYSRSIVFPANEWKNRELSKIFPPVKYVGFDGSSSEAPSDWELQPPRLVKIKKLDIEVREIVNPITHFPSQRPEERAKERC